MEHPVRMELTIIYKWLLISLVDLLNVTWSLFCPVGWGCRIHRLLFCSGVRPPSNECLEYDTKQSDGEGPVMQELWKTQSTTSFPSLPGRLRPGVVATDRVLSIGKIELNCVLILNWIVWNRTVYMYKMNLALITYNGWYAIKSNQTKPNQTWSLSCELLTDCVCVIRCSWGKERKKYRVER